MAIVCYILFEYLNMSMSYIHGLGFSQEPWPASKCCQIHQTVGVFTMSTSKVAVLSLHILASSSSQNKSARLGIQLATTLVRFPPTSGAICQLPLYPPHPMDCSSSTHSTHHAGHESHGTVPVPPPMGKSPGGPLKKHRLLGWYSATQKINKCLLKRDHFISGFFQFHVPFLGLKNTTNWTVSGLNFAWEVFVIDHNISLQKKGSWDFSIFLFHRVRYVSSPVG